MIKLPSTKKSRKQKIIVAVVITVCVVAITLLIYVPIWHHNMFVLGVVGAIMGYQLIKTTRTNGVAKALRELTLSGLMVIGVWNHLWLLIILTLVASAILHLRDYIKK